MKPHLLQWSNLSSVAFARFLPSHFPGTPQGFPTRWQNFTKWNNANALLQRIVLLRRVTIHRKDIASREADRAAYATLEQNILVRKLLQVNDPQISSLFFYCQFLTSQTGTCNWQKSLNYNEHLLHLIQPHHPLFPQSLSRAICVWLRTIRADLCSGRSNSA